MATGTRADPSTHERRGGTMRVGTDMSERPPLLQHVPRCVGPCNASDAIHEFAQKPPRGAGWRCCSFNSVTVEPAPSRRAEIFGLRHRSLSKGRGFDVGSLRRRYRSHTYNCPVRIALRSIPYSAIHHRTCIITKDRWRCPVIFGRRCDS